MSKHGARTTLLAAIAAALLHGALGFVTSQGSAGARHRETEPGFEAWAMWDEVARPKSGCSKTTSPIAQNVMFASHHKTGTVLMEQVRTCLAQTHPEMNVTIDEHFQGAHPIHNFTKIVHWVRNPFSIVVSSYLYHRDVGEHWLTRAGSAKTIMRHLNIGDDEVEIGVNESYTELLQRVPVEVGLHTELRRFLIPLKQDVKSLTGREALEISSAHRRCAGHYYKCMEVCLEPFVDGSTSYATGWRTVLDFVGLCLDDEDEAPLRECLGRADINSPHFDGFIRHVTRHSVSQDSSEQLTRIVQDLDLTLHDGTVKTLEESLGC